MLNRTEAMGFVCLAETFVVFVVMALVGPPWPYVVLMGVLGTVCGAMGGVKFMEGACERESFDLAAELARRRELRRGASVADHR